MNISKSFVSVSAVALSALGLAATLGAPHAFAADAKAYTGSTCVQWDGPDKAVFPWGSVANSDPGGTIFLDCPVVRDATSIASGWVRATDRSGPKAITCTLFAVHRNTLNSAVVFTTGGTKSTTKGADNAAVETLHFGGAGGNGGNGINHYFVNCSIPPIDPDAPIDPVDGKASAVHTYFINEN